jgi:hypothetical protein
MKAVKKWSISIILFGASLHCAFGQSKSLYQYFRPQLIQIDTTKSVLKPTQLKNTYLLNEQPIFCRWEELWTRSSSINLRMRLGSVQYVDELEKK